MTFAMEMVTLCVDNVCVILDGTYIDTLLIL